MKKFIAAIKSELDCQALAEELNRLSGNDEKFSLMFMEDVSAINETGLSEDIDELRQALNVIAEEGPVHDIPEWNNN